MSKLLFSGYVHNGITATHVSLHKVSRAEASKATYTKVSDLPKVPLYMAMTATLGISKCWAGDEATALGYYKQWLDEAEKEAAAIKAIA